MSLFSAPPGEPETVLAYVGSDRSQALAFRVLDYSIRRRTKAPVKVVSLEDVTLPPAPDPRHGARTGFSFSRFAIPELAGRKGRAIYLDADMLVLADILELWRMDMGGAKALCQEELPDRVASTAPARGARRRKQCSVMLLDCARLDWNAPDIIAGLGRDYSYDQLMSELCILTEDDVSYALPLRWNSLELLEPDTALIHYTDMMTQPWVFAANRNGWKWTAELRHMVMSGAITRAEIETEISAGFARPSLVAELDAGADGPHERSLTDHLMTIDRRAQFRPHQGLTTRLNSTPKGLGGLLAGYARRLFSPNIENAGPRS
jgi:hypothetical protein